MRGAPLRVSHEKIVVPDPPADAFPRVGLEDRCDPTRRRVTALLGPGGFGKTTLMAACCRRAVARGDLVVWLSVDDDDDDASVIAHLSYATDVTPEDAEQVRVGSLAGVEMQYIDALLARIRAEDRPCIIAIDELDRIAGSGARTVDHLIWRGPANLHFALTCRQLPTAINVATTVAEGRGMVLGPDELRFTRAEVGAYYGGTLSPKRLRDVWESSNGWPIAVCLERNLVETVSAGVSEVSSNWVAARLLRDIAEDDRRFLLEAACFEWLDVELFDEVLGSGAVERLRGIPSLRGLVEEADGGRSFRLHPLIRRYAESELRLFGDSRKLRLRLAQALAKRGRTVMAIRQAIKADDSMAAAEILERAGALRLAIKDGVKGLQDAIRVIPDEVLGRFPRLDLARLAVTALDGRAFEPQANATLLSLVGGTMDESDADDELQVDRLILRGIFLLCGCASIGSDAARTALAEGGRALTRPGLDPVAVAGIAYGQAVFNYERGDLGSALAALRHIHELADVCPSVALSALILEGAILFAKGDVQEAEHALIASRHRAAQHFPGHESPALTGGAFAVEILLETGRPLALSRRLPEFVELTSVGAWFDVYAAAVDARVEVASRQDDMDLARRALQEAWEFAQNRSLWTLCRWLSAERVSALVREERLEEAKALWQRTGLPTDLEAQVDSDGQSWREMEAICCARVSLLLAEEDHARALVLARSFAAHARAKGLARTESRATALAMQAARAAGDAAAAEELLIRNLKLFRRTGFSRALAAQPEATGAVLERLDTTDPDLNAAKEAIRALIATPGGAGGEGVRGVVFTSREIEVLALLSDSRDQQIASRLGLTKHGVRYHVRNIFDKLTVSNRREAVAKARQLGVLWDPPPPPPPPPADPPSVPTTRASLPPVGSEAAEKG